MKGRKKPQPKDQKPLPQVISEAVMLRIMRQAAERKRVKKASSPVK